MTTPRICPLAVQRPIGYDGGAFIGAPWRIVWHTTEGSTLEGAYAEFRAGGPTPFASHFIVDGKQIVQLVPLDRAAKALQHIGSPETNHANAIQIELVGFSGKPKDPAMLAQARKLALWLCQNFAIPWVWPNGPCMPPVNGRDGNRHNRNPAVWIREGGHYGHEHVPENIHWDPAFTPEEQAAVTAPPTFKFGLKRSAKPVLLKLEKYIDLPTVLKTVPENFTAEHYLPAHSGILGNDNYGDCAEAGTAHETMIWNAIAGTPVEFTDAAVLDFYSKVTGFDANNPDSDQGTDMQVLASYRRKTGIADASSKVHTVKAYGELTAGNYDLHRAAAWLFVAVGIGLNLSGNQVDQFNRGQPWDGALSWDAGGHYTPLIGFQDGNLRVSTWGAVQSVTRAFFEANSIQSIAYLSEEMLKDGKSVNGLDVDTLLKDLAGLTSDTQGLAA